jgi:hypothetical protein
MVSLVRRIAVSRVAATLVAIALTGAPRFVTAERPGHPAQRCQCATHRDHHQCACPIHRVARASGPEKDKVPACHRGTTVSHGGSPQELSCHPCVRSSCGTPEKERAHASSSGVDLFTVPAPMRLAMMPRVERISTPDALPRAATRDPETPPPRAA